MTKPIRALLLTVIFIAAIVSACAKHDVLPKAKLSGSVEDAMSHALVINARVSVIKLKSLDRDQTKEEVSSAQTPSGTFTLGELDPGTYEVRVEAEGFKQALTKVINLEPGATVVLPPIQLQDDGSAIRGTLPIVRVPR